MQKNILKNFINKKLLLLTIVLFTQVLNAQQTTSLTISGYVDEVVNLSITPKGEYGRLNLHSDSVDLPIATIFESSNASKRYLVKARSENNSKIKNADGDEHIPYHMKYGQGPLMVLSQTDQIIKDQSVGGLYSSSGKVVSISFKGVAATTLTSGLYKDTITFTIESR